METLRAHPDQGDPVLNNHESQRACDLDGTAEVSREELRPAPSASLASQSVQAKSWDEDAVRVTQSTLSPPAAAAAAETGYTSVPHHHH